MARVRVGVDEQLAVEHGAAERCGFVDVMWEVKAGHFAIRVVAVDLVVRASAAGRKSAAKWSDGRGRLRAFRFRV